MSKEATIKATIIADSVSPSGVRITTFELEYPRFIHAEFMTHRLFSRNAASSRAIPVDRVIDQVETAPAMPVHWGRNQSGMQAKAEVSRIDKNLAMFQWGVASKQAAAIARELSRIGLHKQIVNRILEPFQMMKVVCTATEYTNFFHLRDHEDAQPEIRELARRMKEAMDQSTPRRLGRGEAHTPYYGEGYWTGISKDLLQDALSISASCCAQVSYRRLDQSIEKARMIYDRLIGDGTKPVHASPFEHQAFPIEGHPEAITHEDKAGNAWSGNFRGWAQYRQLIPNNVKM